MSKPVRNAAAAAGLAVFLAAIPSLGGGEPCPEGSGIDRPFNSGTDLDDCQFTAAEGLVQRGYQRVYNVYCPHRLSPEEATFVGRSLVRGGTQPRIGRNPIASEYRAMKLDASFVSVAHRFHYGCVAGGRAGAATHLKIVVEPTKTRAEDIAATCTARTRAPRIVRNAPFETPFTCTTHLLPGDGPLIDEVLDLSMLKLLGSQLKETPADICYIGSGIQCAPCTSSDTLRARYRFVQDGAACRPGERRYDMLDTIRRCEAACNAYDHRSWVGECVRNDRRPEAECQREAAETKALCLGKCNGTR
jgi:hypothetical protein